MEIRTAIYNYTIFMKILKIKKFKLVKQLEGFDCGLACLCMITKYYGRNCSLRTLNNENKIGFGININKLIDVAESLGSRTLGLQIPFEKLATKVIYPCMRGRSSINTESTALRQSLWITWSLLPG